VSHGTVLLANNKITSSGGASMVQDGQQPKQKVVMSATAV